MIGSTLTKEGQNKLCNLLRRNLDVFAWKPADMTGVPRYIAEHQLNVREGCPLVRQKRRGQATNMNQAIQEEVEKLVDAGIMKEVHYHSWLSNPVMVKKHDGSWRMCVDFKDLNKACPKDDAYKGYHQIKIAKEDEEKTAFITSQGIFCYSKMPFGLRNAEVKIGDEEHSTSDWMNFVIVRSSSPYNGIIRRLRVRKIQVVPLTAHGMLKFPVAGGILTLKSSKIIPIESVEEKIKVAINPEYPEQTIMIGSTLTKEGQNMLCNLLRRNLDVFAWKPADMTGVPRTLVEQLTAQRRWPFGVGGMVMPATSMPARHNAELGVNDLGNVVRESLLQPLSFMMGYFCHAGVYGAAT
nr:reverse transcriptase domain-containing protein [Tanacetum cinerariifolium]